MSGNRGGRGWEPARVQISPAEMRLRQYEAQVRQDEANVRRRMHEHHAFFGDVIDMVEVDGVWVPRHE